MRRIAMPPRTRTNIYIILIASIKIGYIYLQNYFFIYSLDLLSAWLCVLTDGVIILSRYPPDKCDNMYNSGDSGYKRAVIKLGKTLTFAEIDNPAKL